MVTLALWNQVLEVEALQRHVGLREPIVEVFSNDPRLADLAAWQPTASPRASSSRATGVSVP